MVSNNFLVERHFADLGFQAQSTSRTKSLAMCYVLLTVTHTHRILLTMNIAEVVILHYVCLELIARCMHPILTSAFSRNSNLSLLVLSSSMCEHHNPFLTRDEHGIESSQTQSDAYPDISFPVKLASASASRGSTLEG